jgi:hypothetical protein
VSERAALAVMVRSSLTRKHFRILHAGIAEVIVV